VNAQQLYTRATRQLQRMRVEDALRLFERAEQAHFDPDSCAAGRWHCHMLLGDFESAWRASDSIANRGNPDPHRFWDGQPVAGRRVIIRCLHGLGDTIHFIRYARLIRQQARTLVIEAQPTLKSLLQQARIADEVITWGEPEPSWDQQIEIIELPRVFRTTLASIPNQVPYLNVPCEPPVDSANGRPPLRVGLVWASSSYNSERCIPLKQLAELFAVPGASFFSLQAGPPRAELESYATQIINLYDGSPYVLAIAKTLKTLDLVITVDTMMAHLAGAMGRPVWTLLPYQCDWRWMLDRGDSPWYPTMRLFRQKRPTDWQPVVWRVTHELSRLLRSSDYRAYPSRPGLSQHPITAPESQEV
jgi:hypothetical protein